MEKGLVGISWVCPLLTGDGKINGTKKTRNGMGTMRYNQGFSILVRKYEVSSGMLVYQ